MKKRSDRAGKIGELGEIAAREYLLEQGIIVIAGNIRTEYGEIDILGLDGNVMVFFEVKTRKSKKFGYPEISIDQTKMEHMVNSAMKYLQDHPEINNDWRIDVVAITKYDEQPSQIKWFKNAISG